MEHRCGRRHPHTSSCQKVGLSEARVSILGAALCVCVWVCVCVLGTAATMLATLADLSSVMLEFLALFVSLFYFHTGRFLIGYLQSPPQLNPPFTSMTSS